MNHDTRRLARWAGHLHAGLLRLGRGKMAALEYETGRLELHLERIQQLRRRLQVCLDRVWPVAARDCRRELNYTLCDIDRAATQCEQLLGRSEPESISPRFLFEELRQLQEEFDDVKLNAAHTTLSATTEPITLEEIALGRFEIRLELDGSPDAEPTSFLRIVALEPNPASCDETVTHPHVRDERLCAGEAAAAVQQAITSGRIGDLFLLIRSVLQTYNPDSPFISLSKWDGKPCHDCGYTLDDEESYWCDGCENDFCSECFSYCRACDASYCRHCLRDCALCGNSRCEGCLSPCRGCGERVCSDCLKEELCTTCQEKETPDANQDPESNTDAIPSGGGAAGHSEGGAGEGIHPGGAREAEVAVAGSTVA